MLIDRQQLICAELALVDTARTHCKLKRLTLDHRTQIPTRAQQPTPRVKALRRRSQTARNLIKTIRHAAKDATKRSHCASQPRYSPSKLKSVKREVTFPVSSHSFESRRISSAMSAPESCTH